MDWAGLADVLFPSVKRTVEDYEKLYPERRLDKKAEVTRVAPSPTGFIHLGNLFSALANERTAHQSGGVFFLRIEDTDSKRKVEGAVEAVLEAFEYFGIKFDEGAELDPGGKTDYGPFYQSERVDIYHVFAKSLVAKGLAYPCFCTEDEIASMRETQKSLKQTPGYYGEYARCRALEPAHAADRLAAGIPYVLRLRSAGDGLRKFTFRDQIKGEISVTENNQDIVLLKSDGVPTYHFAHAVDDHLMRTTLVMRGEEWLSSLPVHLELFRALGFAPPRYAHTCQIMKSDGGSKRKLSKRSDPEAALSYYREKGYHPLAVKTYLLTLLNSNFEEWLLKNPEAPIEDFKYSIGKMSQSGNLFDMAKLDDISKNVLSCLSAEEMLDFLRAWAAEYDAESLRICFASGDYLLRVLTLCMGIGGKKRRKDFVCAGQAVESIGYFFDERFAPVFEYGRDAAECLEILKGYLAVYDHADPSAEWFDKIKSLAGELGFAVEASAYKESPGSYRGKVGDVAEVIRVAVTGLKNTPDLWTILQILGEQRVRGRIGAEIDRLSRL